MRREFVAMESAMRKFIDQPDYPTMILNTSDNDVLFPTKVLQNTDRQSDSEVFLVFPFACDSVGDYVQKCMEFLKAQADSVNEGRITEGQDPWPPFPLLCLDPRQSPYQRLRAVIDYTRQVLPQDIPVVWGLMPASIGDMPGYKALIAPLLALQGFEDWMTGHRFFVRDNAEQHFLLPELERAKIDTVLVLDIDFSPARVADRLVQTVNDEHVSTPERMQALVQLAAFDLAYQRYDQAVEKYDLLYAYYLEQGDPASQATCLGGAGDVALRAGENELAKKRYQQALAVVVPTGNLAVMLNLFLGAGEACLRLKHYEEAEGYFDYASKTAGKLQNPFSQVGAMEKLGVALTNQGKHEKAVEIWTAAKGLCKQFRYLDGWHSILDQLIALYSNSGMVKEVRECEKEKKSIDQDI